MVASGMAMDDVNCFDCLDETRGTGYRRYKGIRCGIDKIAVDCTGWGGKFLQFGSANLAATGLTKPLLDLDQLFFINRTQ
jgi:hypothetical protein